MSIQFKKGHFNLFIIHIEDIRSENIFKKIKEKIQYASTFFKNTPVVINVENIAYPTNWPKLYKTILNSGLYIIGTCCCKNNTLKKMIIKSGLPILKETIIDKNYTQEKVLTKEKNIVNKTKLINKPIRSGQQIYAHNGDLIIMNNVNPGAEIIADGNIHIYGAMKGRAIAGASGDKTSQIFCTYFSPEVISISGKYLLSEQIPTNFFAKSVKIHLKNNIIIIQDLF
ncbi:septum site-determining protein MinC [Blochmannia endosymbiont of Colobopsis nipponica]|uniref:septum site-determining protein MinC n=1 Tax=Blochmannia endosymbiont of Colobopsis nipponica TaxID=2681987 RepID=UPI00178679F4|nr:septum site-determining protein MinC [Blochmannia endosymbiont of Colobopsis nipponica]QOI11019.1 septum site-determining protein MinC [Blochmannia endosymbiont of Colobopsis nipponica]